MTDEDLARRVAALETELNELRSATAPLAGMLELDKRVGELEAKVAKLVGSLG